jgi:hypothetical protein
MSAQKEAETFFQLQLGSQVKAFKGKKEKKKTGLSRPIGN